MSKKSALNVKTLILCALIIVGLVLAIVGFFGNFLKGSGQIVGFGGSSDIKLSDLDKDFDGFTATNIFAWVTFILAIVVTVLFAVAKLLGVKGLDMIVALVGCLTVVAAILVFVFTIVMASKNSVEAAGGLASVKYSLSAGPILMLIGGLLSGGAAAASAKI